MSLVGIVLTVSGMIVAGIGAGRGYAAARLAMAPLVHEGDPTRRAIEAARPLPMRPRIRLFARRVALSVGWLLVAMYGLVLLTAGLGVGP
ncbi:MAG TPA: hypothetical protein VIV06_12380 [Candidatus Limnocylindrales bacterium]